MLGFYDIGDATYYASRYDQRFGYYLYVPEAFTTEGAADYSLLVLIHGSRRTPQTYRDLFRNFAEKHKCIVLAPLFPAHIYEGGVEANYKFMVCGSLRFDQLLLSMVQEVCDRYDLTSNRFLMHGFSGGGHFAHRFFYLHPEVLLAVSIGAPGMVTLLDDSLLWHCGIRDFASVFGSVPDFDAMQHVPVQMVIGSDDTEAWEITISRDDPLWMEGVNDAGCDRRQRLESLKNSFEKNGIAVRRDVVNRVGHEGYKVLEPVKDFFASVLLSSKAITSS